MCNSKSQWLLLLAEVSKGRGMREKDSRFRKWWELPKIEQDPGSAETRQRYERGLKLTSVLGTATRISVPHKHNWAYLWGRNSAHAYRSCLRCPGHFYDDNIWSLLQNIWNVCDFAPTECRTRPCRLSDCRKLIPRWQRKRSNVSALNFTLNSSKTLQKHTKCWRRTEVRNA